MLWETYTAMIVMNRTVRKVGFEEKCSILLGSIYLYRKISLMVGDRVGRAINGGQELNHETHSILPPTP